MDPVAETFISETPTKLAVGVDFFRCDLAKFSPVCLYTPITAIPNVIQKLLSEREFQHLIVVPFSFRKIWWIQMQSMMIEDPLIWNCPTLLSETGLPVILSLSLFCAVLCRVSTSSVESPQKWQRS